MAFTRVVGPGIHSLSNIDSHNINSSGIITATKFDGPFDSLTISGNLSIGGTLTYEDVTNIDSVGIVTARQGIEVGTRPGIAASISVDGNVVFSGIATVGQFGKPGIAFTDANIKVGNTALDSLTTGTNNTAVGDAALTANTGGSHNTAVGRNALLGNTTASNNTGIGYDALRANTTGAQNVAVGRGALLSNTTASYNVAMGYLALEDNTTGANNTAVGTFVSRKFLNKSKVMITLATAHPSKFIDSVQSAVGKAIAQPIEMKQLYSKTERVIFAPNEVNFYKEYINKES